MFFRKKKVSPYIVTERSEDTKEFEILQIEEVKEEKNYRKNKFVSPIFGHKVKDEVVIPNPHRRSGDIERQMDPFRVNKKISKDDMKKRYGSEYPEFDLVKGSNLEEALQNQNKRSQPTVQQSIFEEPEKTIPIEQPSYPSYKEEFIDEIIEETPSKTSINDFFDKKEEIFEQPKEEVKEKPSLNKYHKTYQLPPLSLLHKPARKIEENPTWIQTQIDVLNRTFDEFGVGAKVLQYTKGPTVTRYEIALDSGVNVKKVTSISDNIKMALAAIEIRIEAPIPGKSTVGIEVPNEVPEVVPFIDIVNNDDFKGAKSPLTIALGLDIDGEGVYTSITKMPHGLVAGATGSGKSVCINTILMSLLFRYSPDDLKLMLIDPKMVELSAYNELPHLITPVITDAKIATAGLKWAVEEMERRFVIFSNERVKDITSYNQKANREDLEHMPYVVIVVDELADLMVVASSAVEEAIMRLTQKARACGMHLIIATQRPSTDVVKGTIKSNIPTRIAFSVSSYIDSMTIIDSAGADKLLGRGDMLFAESGQPHKRVQGAYISDQEIHQVNDFIRAQRDSEFLFTQDKLVQRAANSDSRDELFAEVARYVVIQGEASINKISKEFKIGFNRAQTIVEQMFDEEIVSENVGSKARTVLLTMEELENKLK